MIKIQNKNNLCTWFDRRKYIRHFKLQRPFGYHMWIFIFYFFKEIEESVNFLDLKLYIGYVLFFSVGSLSEVSLDKRHVFGIFCFLILDKD